MDFENYLKSIFESRLSHPQFKIPDHLRESLAYSLFAPGKRIRPRLVLATSQMIELKKSAALPAAAAIEMIHCFTLIHDDLPCLDNDDFRRGKPTNHKKYGEATALLAGDALTPLAVNVLCESQKEIESRCVLDAIQALSFYSGALGVIGGQAYESTLSAQSSLDDLFNVFLGKTCALFIASTIIPACLKGLKSEQKQILEDYSIALGRAFQIVDDLEDEEKEGRSPLSVLFYLNRTQAQALAQEQLHSAIKKVSDLWGASSRPLIEIAEEVIKRL